MVASLARVVTQVIVLNGGSSSGKSTIARRLQVELPQTWLTFGVDTLIEAMPPPTPLRDGAIPFTSGGRVSVSESFRQLDAAWALGVATVARVGVPIIVDEVFLGQSDSQERWRSALEGLSVLWVGVRCDGDVAEARAGERGDRAAGMAALQAEHVHMGVDYDVEVDTTRTSTEACVGTIFDALS